MTAPITLGTRLWRFNVNRRVYAKNERGGSVGGPIYAEHFEPVYVIGENSRSWLLGWRAESKPAPNPSCEMKAAKKDLAVTGCSGAFFTDAARDDAIWKNSHSYVIRAAVGSAPAAALREIVEVLTRHGVKVRGLP